MSSYNCCHPSTLENASILSQSALLKLIAEESRLKLLCILRSSEHSVSELLLHLDLSQSLVSHHLADLKFAGIIKDRKKGRHVFYCLTQRGEQVVGLLQTLSRKGES